jgi:hypothetical protein
VTTPLDLINLALLDAGVIGQGQTANAEDTNNAYTRLQFLVQQWQRKRYLVFQQEELGLVSTGAQSYSIGPGGAFNVPIRPDRLDNGCFFRQLISSSPNQVDYPLELIESWEDYSRIRLKQLQTFPAYVFFDPGFPLGTIYFWPVPQASIYQMFVLSKISLSTLFTSQVVVLDQILPNEYFQALYLSLAEILRTAYRLPPDPMLIQRAKESREVLRGANAALARLHMPDSLVRPGVYNPYSDQIS